MDFDKLTNKKKEKADEFIIDLLLNRDEFKDYFNKDRKIFEKNLSLGSYSLDFTTILRDYIITNEDKLKHDKNFFDEVKESVDCLRLYLNSKFSELEKSLTKYHPKTQKKIIEDEQLNKKYVDFVYECLCRGNKYGRKGEYVVKTVKEVEQIRFHCRGMGFAYRPIKCPGSKGDPGSFKDIGLAN